MNDGYFFFFPSFVRGCFGHVLSDLSEGLQVAPYDRINEHASLFFSVTDRYINDVRFNHNCSAVTVTVKRCNGAVVPQTVVSAYDAEADDVALVIQDL